MNTTNKMNTNNLLNELISTFEVDREPVAPVFLADVLGQIAENLNDIEALENIAKSLPITAMVEEEIESEPEPVQDPLQERIDELIASEPFELDTFQRESIEKIVRGENILVCAPTSSGKTICAISGIRNALRQGKRVIYTSPIKSLSNQKYAEFKRKFKGIATVGLITGDIKCELDADILIMTAEILRNLLTGNKEETDLSIGTSIDFQNDVSVVVMDEVHYINDPGRGKVWEETLVLLDSSIRLVLLSATLNNAQSFADWLTKIKGVTCNVIRKEERIIPLNHYMYYSFRKFGKIKDKEEQHYAKAYCNKLIKVKAKDTYYQNEYTKMANIKRRYYKMNQQTSQIATIASLVTFLKKKKKLPALFFVFSKKKTETMATNLNMTLNSAPEQIRVRKLVRQNLLRLEESALYTTTPEYHKLVSLWERGIAYHHAGLQSIYKELIEMLCKEGLIKAIFATETFSVGINAPIKTVVFTSIQKYTGEGFRYLTSTEYFQMAGRAGRRGLDTVGNVILLSNYMNLPDRSSEMGSLISGKSGNVNSRFKLNYQLALTVAGNNDIDLDSFLDTTFRNSQHSLEVTQQQKLVDSLENPTIEESVLESFYYLVNSGKKLSKRQTKKRNKIKKMKGFAVDYELYLRNYYEKTKLDALVGHQNTPELPKIINVLRQLKYITGDKLESANVTVSGIIASKINSVNTLVLTEMITSGLFDNLDEPSIAGLLGGLLSKSYRSEINENSISYLDIPSSLRASVEQMIAIRDRMQKVETDNNLDTLGTNWELNFDMVEYAYKWTKEKKFTDLNYIEYTGTFIKDVLRLDNLVQNMEYISALTENTKLSDKLANMHEKLVRSIVSPESLYIIT